MITGLRELLWALAAILIAVLLAYGLVLLTPHEATGEVPRPRPYYSATYDVRILELDREAIEEAYKKHIMLLFENWVKDVKGQPGRAMVGADSARKVYIDSLTVIDERRDQLKK